MSKLREIVLDTETTGLEPSLGHRIIEIGAVEMVNKVPTNNVFHSYINPEFKISDSAYKIHGISNDFVRDKPKFIEVVDKFLDFIGSSYLVIHNAKFDMKFLNNELVLIKKPCLTFDNVIDTLKLARQAFPGSRVSLDALCKRFHIDNSKRKFHGALLDAQLLSEVYIELTGGNQKEFLTQDLQPLENTIKSAQSFDTYINTIKPKIIYPDENEIKNHKIMLEKIKSPT